MSRSGKMHSGKSDRRDKSSRKSKKALRVEDTPTNEEETVDQSSESEGDSNSGTSLRSESRDEPRNLSLKRVRGPNHGADVPNDANKRPWLRIAGNTFLDSSVVSDITATFKGHYEGVWPTWLKVPKRRQELMFENFERKFNFHPSQRKQVFDAWHKACVRRFREALCEERRKAAIFSKSNNPKDWKNYKSWIRKRYWVGLIDEVWSTDKWQNKSRAGKKNRLTEDGTAPPTHTGGSCSFAAHREKMAKELKRPVSKLELFDRTHRKEKGKGEYICHKAKKVREAYDKSVEESYPDAQTCPDFDLDLWTAASGKNGVYGFGPGYGTRKQLMDSQGQVQTIEQELEQLKSDRANALEEVRELKEKLPDMLQKMLGKLGLTNQERAGVSRPNQKYLLHEDEVGESDEEESDEKADIDDESDDDSFERACADIRSRCYGDAGGHDSKKKGKAIDKKYGKKYRKSHKGYCVSRKSK